MAVQRSLVVENTRKSIGQLTYYRVRGVQLARSKPTFAPGREFTNPQKLQQAKMKIAQAALQSENIKLFAPYCNCAVIKRYNAASKMNRLTANLLDSTTDLMAQGILNGDYDPDEVARDNLGNIMNRFSVGNLFVPQIDSSMWDKDESNVYFDLTINSQQFTQWIRIANRILRWKNPPVNMNIGVCGVASQTRGTEPFYTIFPQLTSQEDYDEENILRFQFAAPNNGSLTGTLYMYLCLFITEAVKDDYDYIGEQARVCTSTWLQTSTFST